MASIEDIGQGVKTICAATAICVGAGLAFDFSNFAPYEARPNSLEPETYADETQHNLLRIEQRLGETCVQTLTIYLPGNKLADRPEDSIVSDLLRNPDQVCGTNPTTIRTDYSEYAVAVANATEAATDIPGKKEEAEDYKAYLDEQRADNNFHGWKVAGGLGLGVSTAVGIGVLTSDIVSNRARKRRAQQFWAEGEDT